MYGQLDCNVDVKAGGKQPCRKASITLSARTVAFLSHQTRLGFLIIGFLHCCQAELAPGFRFMHGSGHKPIQERLELYLGANRRSLQGTR